MAMLLRITSLLFAITLTKLMPVDDVANDIMEGEEDGSDEAESEPVHLVQGDIVVDLTEDGIQHQGVREDRTWPYNVVPFELDKSFSDSQKQNIKNAINDIESASCIKFRPRERGDRYFVSIIRRPGGTCHSVVGRSTNGNYINVGQPLQLSDSCLNDKGTILHELMHAIGFQHEQSRTDRDEFVEILWENIEKDQKANFDKTDHSTITDLGTNYDFHSIMHYKWNSWARNESMPTIKPRNDDIDYKTLGVGENLSPIDKIEINKLYNCDGPSVPERFIGQVKYNTVVLSWTSPQVKKGRLIGYEILYTNDSSLSVEHWALLYVKNPRRHKITISDLKESTEYTFRIRAINEKASGSLSESVSVTTWRERSGEDSQETVDEDTTATKERNDLNLNTLGPCQGFTTKPAVENCKKVCKEKYDCNKGICIYSTIKQRIQCTCLQNGEVCNSLGDK